MKLTEEERRQVFMQTILIIFSFTFFLALLGCATTTPTDAGKQTALSGNQETVHEAGDPETQLNHAISLIEKGKLDEAIDQLLNRA